MQNSGKNGNKSEPTTKPTEPTEPTNLPTQDEQLSMELTVLNSLLAKFQSRQLISITQRDASGTPVYSINLPVGTWEMAGGKFYLVPTTVPTTENVSQQAEIAAQ